MSNEVQQVMTKKIITVPLAATVQTARDIMKSKSIRHLAVVDILNDIVGVLSDRDIANIEGQNSLVKDFMSTPFFRMNEETSIRNAAFKMMQEKISCLVIDDEDGEAVGIVTTNDLLWYLTYLLRREPKELHYAKHLLNLQAVGEVANELSQMGI